MFNSRYRHPGPDNVKTLMGELQPLGKAFAIIAGMMHRPNHDLPTKLAGHNLYRRLFLAAAQYALSDEEIRTVLAHPNQEEKSIFYHYLLCCPLSTTLYNEASVFFRPEFLDALYIILCTNFTWDL